MAIWIPGVTWELFTLTTGERVALQVEHEDAGVVRGLELDRTGWPVDRLWEIEPALIVRRDPLVVSEETGLLTLADVDTLS